LLANDTDERQPAEHCQRAGAVGGTVSLVGGNVVFTPTANFNGPAALPTVRQRRRHSDCDEST
jgi:hypothetical protein